MNFRFFFFKLGQVFTWREVNDQKGIQIYFVWCGRVSELMRIAGLNR
jgi:hypothetical protein